MFVGMHIALTSKTDALLNLQVSAFGTLMKGANFVLLIITQWYSSARKEAQLHHRLVEEQTVRYCSDAACAARVGSLDRVRCAAGVHAQA